jgi:HD-GYP domain-containing protein (c-di-GMP phosphodiesterase class II)
MSTLYDPTLSGFRRRILVRLLAVGLAASAMCGAALFFLEGAWVQRVGASLAAIEARGLVGLLADDAAPADLSAVLADLLDPSVDAARGSFVSIEIRDRAGRSVGRAVSPRFADAVGRFAACAGQHSWIGESRCGRQLIDDAVLVLVQVPVVTRDGRDLGRFDGLYRLAPPTVQAIRIDNVKLFAVVIGGVLLTSLALYPLMATLQGRVVAEAKDLLRANLDTLKLLGCAVAKRDYGTGTHNCRVTLYAVHLAEALGLEPAAIRSLIKGALLHDIGKIAVQDAILLKPGPLDPVETEAMRAHVRHGLDIIATSHWLHDAAAVVGGHHEWVDGTGYPAGLVGGAVPLAARIFAIADVFDALTSARPYKAAVPLDDALAVLDQGRGRHFDGILLDTFIGLASGLYRTLSGISDSEAAAREEAVLTRYFRL